MVRLWLRECEDEEGGEEDIDGNEGCLFPLKIGKVKWGEYTLVLSYLVGTSILDPLENSWYMSMACSLNVQGGNIFKHVLPRNMVKLLWGHLISCFQDLYLQYA